MWRYRIPSRELMRGKVLRNGDELLLLSSRLTVEMKKSDVTNHKFNG